MSTLTAQSKITSNMKDTLSTVSAQMPNGQVPNKEALADLKGIFPNPKTMQNVLKPGTNVPSNFLADFDPTQDLIANIPIPTVNLSNIEIEPSEVPIEEPVNTEGLTEKEIQEAERKRELRQKRNEIATDVKNKVKDKAKNLLGNLENQANSLIESTVQGAITGAITNNPAIGEIALKIAAFKFFKAQIAEGLTRTTPIKESVQELTEQAKDVLKGATQSITQTGKIVAESVTKETQAVALEAQTKTMKATFPMHPGPGNLNDSTVTQKAREARDKANGFLANMEQKAKNVGNFLKEALLKIGNLLSTILKLLQAILALVAFILFLKQLLELLMLLLFKKNNSTSVASDNSKANSPEEFLAEIGYPGFTEQNFSNIIKNVQNDLKNPNISDNFKFPQDPSIQGNTTTNPNNSSTSNTINASSINSSVPDVNTIDPIIIGDVQIGQPILPTDLGPESGKDFNTHPLLGDLSEIHPQIVNELYNNGVLPKVNQPALDPNQYSEDLDKLYDDIVNELVETKQIEYIEKLYNIDFEMIGYKRYRA